MKNKSCRNCGSSEIFSKLVVASDWDNLKLLPIGNWFSPTHFELRVCGSCGLAEWFVPEKHLAKVREKFDRI
jgi:ribosomal protein S27AE